MRRLAFEAWIVESLGRAPVVAILGPRQCGKSTLARSIASRDGAIYLDLENPSDLSKLDNPALFLAERKGLVVLDEIQRRPDLFPLLRVLADRKPRRARFLVLGSASRDLIQQGSETLAGRIEFVELTPFQLAEGTREERLWVRGGFPRSYLARSARESLRWREGYVATYLERDIPQLGFRVPARRIDRFWRMLSHYHGQVFHAAEIAGSLMLDGKTARHYLDILVGTFMVRELKPWHENIGKREIKAPKIYLRDSGILHSLLDIPDLAALKLHPKLGASWEGFALEEIIRAGGWGTERVFHWGVHGQADLDLFVLARGRRIGFEIKFTDRPSVSVSMRKALDLLKLDELRVVFPGSSEIYPLDERIRAGSLAQWVRLVRGKEARARP